MQRTPTMLVPLMLTATLALGGCVVHTAGAVRIGPPVVIAHGHHHDAHCGHYQYRGKWYHAANHHHGKKCGHKLKGGVWIRVR